MTRINIPLILQCLTLLVPLNLYVVGDRLGSGIQWALFRFQDTYVGVSLIPFTSDVGYVMSGAISGRSAFSLSLSAIGTCMLIGAFCIILLSYPYEIEKRMKTAGILTMTGGGFFLVSSVLQYGFRLNGPAGFVIPVGIPLVVIIGAIVYTGYYARILCNEYEKEDDDPAQPSHPE